MVDTSGGTAIDEVSQFVGFAGGGVDGVEHQRGGTDIGGNVRNNQGA